MGIGKPLSLYGRRCVEHGNSDRGQRIQPKLCPLPRARCRFGGLAPDLRYLEADEYGDEWYTERFRDGYTQNGITKMPAFGELLGQKAAWAIRTYIETRPDDGALDEHSARLEEIRDELGGWQDGDTQPLIAELRKIAEQIETGSGAPVADSAAFRALTLIDRKNPNFAEAANQLTIGLSAAR